MNDGGGACDLHAEGSQVQPLLSLTKAAQVAGDIELPDTLESCQY